MIVLLLHWLPQQEVIKGCSQRLSEGASTEVYEPDFRQRRVLND